LTNKITSLYNTYWKDNEGDYLYIMNKKFFLAASLSTLVLSAASFLSVNKKEITPVEAAPLIITERMAQSSIDAYYSSISSSLTGTALADALATKLKSDRQSTYSYSNLPTAAFPYIDVDPNNPNSGAMVSFYSGTVVAAGYSGMNREHTWPDSHGGNYIENDPHVIRPTLTTENSDRGNQYYAELPTEGWDPGKFGNYKYRGISARIIFYGYVVGKSSGLVLEDVGRTQGTGTGNRMGKLSDLLKWNLQYPVDKTEIIRNETLDRSLGWNRNPFIDDPSYACRIWGDYNTTTQNICSSYSVDPVPVTGINMSTTSFTLNVNGTKALNASVIPSNATNKNITYKTSNATVATVSTSGLVTGKSAGTATITATTVEGGFSKSVTVTVNAGSGETPVTDVVTAKFYNNLDNNASLNDPITVDDINNGETGIYDGFGGLPVVNNVAASTSYLPRGGGLAIGSSSNPGSVTLTLNDEYKATKFEAYFNNAGKPAVPTLSADVSGTTTNGTISPNQYENPTTAEPYVFTADSPAREITIGSSLRVALVELKIYTETSGGGGGEITPPAPTSVTVTPSSATLKVGETVNLTATVAPAGAPTGVTWSSNNNAVATVNNGKVTAIGAGNAVITATSTENTAIKGTANITVTAPDPVPVDYVLGSFYNAKTTNDGGVTPTATLMNNGGTEGTISYLGFGGKQVIKSLTVSQGYLPRSGGLALGSNKNPGILNLTLNDAYKTKKVEVWFNNAGQSVTASLSTSTAGATATAGVIGATNSNPSTGKPYTLTIPSGTTNIKIDTSLRLALVEMRIYLEPAGVTPEEEANTWASTFLSETSAGCAALSQSMLSAKWPTLKTTYTNLSANAKSYIGTLGPNVSGNTIEQALARYQFIVNKYNFDHYITHVVVNPLGNINRINTTATQAAIVLGLGTLSLVFGGIALRRKRRNK
jgi:uncharacterized protein YjdB